MKSTAVRERLKTAEFRLGLYLDAEEAVLSGQSYSVEGLHLERADLGKVQNMIRTLMNEIETLRSRLDRTGRHSRVVIPKW